MKRYILMLSALWILASCEEITNSAEESKVTFLPAVEMQGESDIVLDCNAVSYVDEGCIMTEGGEEIEVTTTNYGLYFDGHYEGGSGDWSEAHWIYGNLDPSGPDMYDINYSGYNVDSIPGVALRHVYWPVCNGDMVTSIAGMYKMSVRRNGTTGGGLPVDDNGPFFIKDLGNDEYALSDGMGGWYEHGRGFGPYDGPSLGMTVTANDIPGNDFTYGPTFSQNVFGGPVVIQAFTVNAGAKTIDFTTGWDSDFNGSYNFTFTVTLTQCPDGVACWD